MLVSKSAKAKFLDFRNPSSLNVYTVGVCYITELVRSNSLASVQFLFEASLSI